MRDLYKRANLLSFLYFDIETVREYATFEDFAKEKNPELWAKVAKPFMEKEGITLEEAYLKYAALYVEYSKVVSFGLGIYGPDFTKKIAKISGHNEKEILEKFAAQLEKLYEKNNETILSGHNVIEYDIPFIIKRMVKHKIKIPTILRKFLFDKSWDVMIADTIKDWRMGGNRMMNLDAVCEYLGIPSPKDGDVSGHNLGAYYWSSVNSGVDPLPKIDEYVMKDISSVMDITYHLSEVLS